LVRRLQVPSSEVPEHVCRGLFHEGSYYTTQATWRAISSWFHQHPVHVAGLRAQVCVVVVQVHIVDKASSRRRDGQVRSATVNLLSGFGASSRGHCTRIRNTCSGSVLGGVVCHIVVECSRP